MCLCPGIYIPPRKRNEEGSDSKGVDSFRLARNYAYYYRFKISPPLLRSRHKSAIPLTPIQNAKVHDPVHVCKTPTSSIGSGHLKIWGPDLVMVSSQTPLFWPCPLLQGFTLHSSQAPYLGGLFVQGRPLNKGFTLQQKVHSNLLMMGVILNPQPW